MNNYFYLETSGGQSYNLYLNVVHLFNTSVNKTSVAALDSCFPLFASNLCCSIAVVKSFIIFAASMYKHLNVPLMIHIINQDFAKRPPCKYWAYTIKIYGGNQHCLLYPPAIATLTLLHS
jgi:hypothetical protein